MWIQTTFGGFFSSQRLSSFFFFFSFLLLIFFLLNFHISSFYYHSSRLLSLICFFSSEFSFFFLFPELPHFYRFSSLSLSCNILLTTELYTRICSEHCHTIHCTRASWGFAFHIDVLTVEAYVQFVLGIPCPHLFIPLFVDHVWSSIWGFLSQYLVQVLGQYLVQAFFADFFLFYSVCMVGLESLIVSRGAKILCLFFRKIVGIKKEVFGRKLKRGIFVNAICFGICFFLF